MASESTHQPKMLEIREFTKTDWYGMAGAESPVHVDGVVHSPMIGEMEITLNSTVKTGGQIVIDKNGVTFTIPEDDEGTRMSGFDIECPFEIGMIIAKSFKASTTQVDLLEEFGLEITDW